MCIHIYVYIYVYIYIYIYIYIYLLIRLLRRQASQGATDERSALRIEIPKHDSSKSNRHLYQFIGNYS